MKADVKCLFSEMWSIDRLIPNPKNPNKHPQSQLQLLGKVITRNGWRNPIVVSSRSGLIVKGHGRFEAAKLAGMEEVPVEIQHYDSDAEETADMIADNRIAELSERDPLELVGVLTNLSTDGLGVVDAGFTEADFQKLVDGVKVSERDSSHRVGAPIYQYNIVFSDEQQQQQWFAFLKRLKSDMPNNQTVASRICSFIETRGGA